MVREDILSWLKAAIIKGENANDAAIKLIVAGHDMYEVNDALRQITSEIADKKFEVESTSSFMDNLKKPMQKGASLGPRPSKEIQELPKVEFNKRQNDSPLKFSRKTTLILIGAVIVSILALTGYIVYLLSV